MDGKTPTLTPLQAQGQVLAQHSRLLTEASDAVSSIQQQLQSVSSLQQSQATAQQAQVSQLTALVQALTDQVATLTARLSPAPAPPASAFVHPEPALNQEPADTPPTREPHLVAPALYDGSFALCREFLMQCEYVFALQPSMYSSAAARIAYIANLTTGQARRWVMASQEGCAPYMQDYAKFTEEFRTVFDHDVHGQDADSALSALHQGSSSVAEYATEFRILAARCQWNESALFSAFRRGLAEPVKDALAGRERPSTLHQLISLSISLDERHRERKREKAHQHRTASRPSSSPPSSHSRPFLAPSALSPSAGEEPMQLGRARLTTAEREHRRQQGLCMYCANSAHSVDSCPFLPSRASSTRPAKDRAHPLGGSE